MVLVKTKELQLATWAELSRESLQAARSLAREGFWRGSINRSYYAAYCAVTGELVKRRVRFARGWNNPAHEQLLSLIEHNLSLPRESRRRIKTILRLLRHAREDADYRPAIAIDRKLALNSLRDAAVVMKEFGVEI